MSIDTVFIKQLLPMVKEDKIEEFVRAFTKMPLETNKAIKEAEVLRIYGLIMEWAMIYFGVSDRDIKSPSRLQPIVFIRQVAIYALHNHFNGVISLEKIGLIFNRDHSTIIYANRKCNNAIYDKKIASFLLSLNEYFHERKIYSLDEICKPLIK